MTTITGSNGQFSSSFLDAVNGTGGSSGASGSSSASGSSATSLQNNFLQLLVAQMNNQDPLNPMDNSQVTSQLAQISTVSGLNQLNTTLSSITGQINSSQNLQAAGLVGKGVLVPGSTVGVSGGQATPFGVQLPAAADTVTVDIVSPSGATVRTLHEGALAAGPQVLTWDGKDNNGVTVADGSYTVKVTATANGQNVGPTALNYQVVSSVVTGANGAPSLNLGTGGVVSLSSVQEIL
ncbi:flagellar basal body rod modification protein FlgD [Pandoraea thiooxydans]|uniref:Basal-body rod modification protein FlgD n=1 Tax=Pandoraea thiooxydans TaxID=445709 RepID=A0A0G3EY72_9BURK|nr:flagellar hook assembly protein FlgD [Pandoraea thiooxydans]AKJ69711.1 flagellar basal body rod modification protein [Pandoraea thiooxydans]APR97447.1 flagellar basal body rod modification protein FlgD [Pandoraea thiooxydans]